MARSTPRNPTIPTPAPLAEPDDRMAAIGERLRQVALGLTATLMVMRPYWSAEDAASGSGLGWVAATLVVLAVAVASMLIGGAVRFRWSWVDAAFYALILLVGLSATGAQERRVAINLAWEWAGIGVMFLLVRSLPRTRGESATMAGLLAATAAAVAGFGLYQVTVELPEIRRSFLANPGPALQSLGIAPGSPSEALFRQRLLASKEPYATFALTNSLAGFLLGPIAMGLAVLVDNLRRKGRGSRVVAIAMAAIPAAVLVVCLLLTKSRSAYLGLAVGVAVIAWRQRRALPPKALAGVGIVLALGLAGVVIALVSLRQLDREIVTEAKKSLGYRLEYWAGAWDILRDAPPPFPVPSGGVIQVGQEIPTVRPEARAFWGGLGPGNFAGPYLRHKRPEASEEIVDPHNFPLEVWCTAGLPALVAILLALGLGLRETLRRSEVDEPAVEASGRSAWLVGFGAFAWVAVVISGKLNPFDSSTQADLFMRWVVLGLGWIAAVALGQMLWRRRPIGGDAAGVAVLAIAINLLAAGGIGLPTVAMPFWLLLAVGLNLRDDRPCGVLRERTTLSWGIGAAIGWAAAVGSFAGAILPFWVSEIATDRGEALLAAKQPAFELARGQFQAAIEADKANVRPWVDLAELESLYARSPEARMRSEVWERVFIALDKAMERPWRNPHSLAIRRLQVQFARQILQALPDPTPRDLLSLRSKIARASRKAAELYPTSAPIRAQLAQASAEIGMFADAVREAEAALTLHDLTPHLDKKLPDESVRELRRKLPEWIESRDHPPAPPAGTK